MKHFLVYLTLVFSLLMSGSTFAQLSPQACIGVGGEIYQMADLRDQGTPLSEMLVMMEEQVPEGKARDFYKFWLTSVYGIHKDKKPVDIATDFTKQCFKAGGDVSKLYGPET